MASGHVKRANRPNTWLHRPATRREDSPCQLGVVHTWHKADITLTSGNVPSGRAAWRRCPPVPSGRRAETPSRHPCSRDAHRAGCHRPPCAGDSPTSPCASPTVHVAGPSIQLKQIERIEKGLPAALTANGGPEHVEVRHSVRSTDDALPIDGDRLDPECLQRLGDQRHPVGPVTTVA